MATRPANAPDCHSSANSDVDCAAISAKEAISLLNQTCDSNGSRLVMRKEPARAKEFDQELPLKKLRCTVLKIDPSAHAVLNDGKYMRRCNVSKPASFDRIISSVEKEDSPLEFSEFPSELSLQEEDESECVTPTAREHRILESKILVCPPPPKKRKAFALKRGISLPPAYHPPNFLTTPSDLQTFPECIRALFDK